MKPIPRVIILTFAALAVGVVGLAVTGIRINTTVSAPVGFYVPDSNGLYIAFCPEDGHLSAGRHYRRAAGGSNGCPDGDQQLLKPVIARAGDVVVLDSAGVTVNGNRVPHSTPLDHDSEGRPMVRWPLGTYAVAPDQIWVISSYSGRSYDSRYFGPVAVASVRARYRPLWVAE